MTVVDTFEKQNLCCQTSSLLIALLVGWRTPTIPFPHLLGTVKSPIKIESNAAKPRQERHLI